MLIVLCFISAFSYLTHSSLYHCISNAAYSAYFKDAVKQIHYTGLFVTNLKIIGYHLSQHTFNKARLYNLIDRKYGLQ